MPWHRIDMAGTADGPAAAIAVPMGRRRSRGWWLRLGLGAAIVVALAWRFHPLAVLQHAVAADPGLVLLAVGAYLASQAASAVRLGVLARAAGFEQSLGSILRIHASGAFFGLMTPTTLGSDACRVLYLGRGAPGTSAAVSVVLFDRLQGLVALAAVAAVAAFVVTDVALPSGAARAIAVGGTAAVAGWFLLVAVASRLRDGHPVRRALGTTAGMPSLLATTSLVSLVVVGFQVASQALLATAIGLSVPLSHVAIYHPLVVLGGTLPITLAGMGTREATYLWMLAPAGVAAEAALAWSVLWLAVGILNGLVGGLVVVASGMALTPARVVGAARPRIP